MIHRRDQAEAVVIAETESADEHMRRLVQVSMALQALSNGREVSNPKFAYLNKHFILPNIHRVKEFLENLAVCTRGPAAVVLRAHMMEFSL